MLVTCTSCGGKHQTRRSDPTTWPCPTCAAPKLMRFTIDPQGTQTQFVPASRPTKGD